ncbi:uncharacterized protein LOC119832400 [Zerene cesonia]|uniref:uncharacterized protein LOC119832400 n=1 Tax=Zerene cesonia TaxID=33412 RepID=UPI0018E4FA97|nr:uncharacterized protein LOC119832400 [Zerene cesonia]
MILLPVCEPTSTSMTMHASKKASKKSDMRVSCEAIPEETGTSPQPHHAQVPHNPQAPHNPLAPHNPQVPLNQPAPLEQSQGSQNHHKPHPHLMTYNSDPGAVGSDTEVDDNSNSDGLNVVHAHHQLQKTSSDSTVTTGAGAGAGGAGAAAGAGGGGAHDELPPLARSKRSNTISVMSPTERARYQTARSDGQYCDSRRIALMDLNVAKKKENSYEYSYTIYSILA